MLEKKQIEERVREIMDKNYIHGHAKNMEIKYCFTKPAAERYPFQYFWDTCFHVFILCNLHEYDRAKDHIKTLLAAQRQDGFIGNIVYWKHVFPAKITDFFQMRYRTLFRLHAPHMSAIIQPPLIAQAVYRIYQKTKDKEFLYDVVPQIKKYFEWLMKYRDFDGDGLISIVTPFESGMDWKATYDPVVGFGRQHANWILFYKIIINDFKNFIRDYNYDRISEEGYFRVKDAGYNAIYVKDLETLAELCRLIGNHESEEMYKERVHKATKRIQEIMYDKEDKAFYDVYGKDNKKLKIQTPTIFFPVILNDIPDEIDKEVLDRHFFDVEQFNTEYPMPSLAQNDPAFDPKGSQFIWRGPTWVVNNWLMHKYLIENNHDEFAQKLIDSVRKLIEKSGFREYYNPFTGEGYGAHNFTWSGLVLDMINLNDQVISSRKEEEKKKEELKNKEEEGGKDSHAKEEEEIKEEIKNKEENN